jgi:hypothetical protein
VTATAAQTSLAKPAITKPTRKRPSGTVYKYQPLPLVTPNRRPTPSKPQQPRGLSNPVKPAPPPHRNFNLAETLTAVDPTWNSPGPTPPTNTPSGPSVPTLNPFGIPGLSSLPKLYIPPRPVISLRPIKRSKSPRASRSVFGQAVQQVVKQSASDQQLVDNFIADVLEVAQI